jgi:two-component system, NtrC family, nitrogen regulation sensor histidine kinase NtrY
MGFNRRALSGYSAPTAALAGVLLLLGWLGRYPGFYADKLVLALAAAGLVWLLWSRTRRTNLLIARFIASLDHGDLAQSFRVRGRGSGLEELGAAFDDALRRLQAERHSAAAENRFASALVDEAPTPLLAVDGEGVVHLANKAARRLFREADGRRAQEYERYGADLARALLQAAPGERRVCRVRWNGLAQRAVLAVALADRQGTPWRIVSVQIIQSELDSAEMATQTDLVRVLTHEIMNSLTPVTSLAESAGQILDRVDGQDAEALEDARMAVQALSRRAAAITHFVHSYRAFSESPSVTIRPFDATSWLRDLMKSFEATPQARGVSVRSSVSPTALRVAGDADLLGQVMLNLLKNAGQACGSGDAPSILVSLFQNEAGRAVLRVSDNGPGVAAALEEEIFLPFFTTKGDGTGIGLSFAKQIVLLHGGAIGLAEPELGGATVQIILP